MPGARSLGGKLMLPKDSGAVLCPPERSASQAIQCSHQDPSCRCAAASQSSASGGVSGLTKYPRPRCFGSATTVWMWPLEHSTNSEWPETSWVVR